MDSPTRRALAEQMNDDDIDDVKTTSTSVAEYIPLGMQSYFALVGFVSVLPILFVVGFTGAGYGLENTNKSLEYEDEASWIIGANMVLVFVLYIFDVQFWKSPVGYVFQILSCATVALAGVIALLLLVFEYPYGPICVFTILLPLYLLCVKRVVYPNVRVYTFVSWMHIVLFSLGVALTVFFIGWALSSEDNTWDNETRAYYSDQVGCVPTYEDREYCENTITGNPCFFNSAKTTVTFDSVCITQCIDIYDDCTSAFIVWANPGLCALSLLVLGAIMKFLKPHDDAVSDHVSFIVKCCAFMLFVFWVAASLAGAGAGIGSALIAFAMSMFIGMAIILMAVFWNAIFASEENMDKTSGRVQEWMRNNKVYLDIGKGLLILAGSPILLSYLCLSIINQRVRKLIGTGCNRMGNKFDIDHDGIFTKRVSHQVDEFKSWDRTTILTYAVYWGIAYVSLDVLANRMTILFLSWLIDFSSDLDLGAVTGIVILVGMILFLLPPVPGLPIYLASGIVLVASGEEILGLIGSITYACAISLGIKLFACAVQQKLIGELLGTYITVRKLVQLNSTGMRAIRLILGENRLTARKVAILIGGPDWPTSVLCGIMGLDLLPILFGTLPVILLVVPTVLAGSFAYMKGLEKDDGTQEYPWADTLAAVMSAIAACVMFYMMFSAASAAKDALENEQDEIAKIPIDDEVVMAEAAEERAKRVYNEVTQWEKLPKTIQICLILSVALATLSCYILFIFNVHCFEEYDLLYTIDDNLDGDWTNLFLTLGRVALLIFVLSIFFLGIFMWWASSQTQMVLGTDLEIIAEPVGLKDEIDIAEAPSTEGGVEIRLTPLNNDENR